MKVHMNFLPLKSLFINALLIVSITSMYKCSNSGNEKNNEIKKTRAQEILEKEKKHFKCEMCEGEDKNKPVLGLVIIKGLKKKGDFFEGGKITDPKNGKSYQCKMNLEGKDKLIVRGYIGISLFGRSQTWFRI